MAINGNNIFILAGKGSATPTLIAGTRSNEIETDCDMIEISNPSSGDWKQYMAGRKAWTVQTSFLVTTVTNIRELLSVGSSYTLIFRDRNNTSGASVTGTAILKNCKISAIRGNLVTGSFAFQGTGALR